jgi:hypothetical protein
MSHGARLSVRTPTPSSRNRTFTPGALEVKKTYRTELGEKFDPFSGTAAERLALVETMS